MKQLKELECPVCKSKNYIFLLDFLVDGGRIGFWDTKCINCNSYFHLVDLLGETLTYEEAAMQGKIINPDGTVYKGRIE